MFEIDEDDYLAHYGTPRRSGRYPYGSGGEDAPPKNPTFLDMVADMRRNGMTDTEIARGMGISTTEFRAKNTIAKNEKKQADIAFCERLKAKGYSNVAIGERLGIGESSVRALLAPGVKEKADALIQTAASLKKQVDAKTYVDVGAGVENYLGISKDRLNASLAVLKEQGYEVHRVKIPQLGTGKETEMRILTLPGKTQRDVFLNRGEIKPLTEYSPDGGHTFVGTHPPLSINPNRVKVRYAEEGGANADGVIYVRPGKEDLSLGNSRYAQVRVKVGDGHYLKGMAMYKDDLPDGVDLVFNTNKSNTGNKLDAMKKIKDDPDLPFGAVVRQIVKHEGTPKERVTSAMNLVNEEGQWLNWSKNISPQVLSKQSPSLAKGQLDATFNSRKQELDAIMALTNPTVKKKLLNEFAESADSASVHLKSARLPRQNWHVILPIETIKPGEIYAPNYEQGERVALIRYPHGGKFEIPDLVVNNRHRDSRAALKDAVDAVGIHPKVAERLSGADFDGDTVLVIPNNSSKVKSAPALEGLKGFDPKTAYPKYEGMPKLTPDRMQQLMGDVSNLITDMTLKGAPNSDLVRAVRHSMVVIDAEKHELNWKLSAEVNNIKQLKQEYQGGANKGAATLISRAKSPKYIDEIKGRPHSEGGPIDPVTGKKVFVPTGRTRIDKSGKVVTRKTKLAKLAYTDDAHTLSSGTPMEKVFADHSNKLKTMANEARRAALQTPPLRRSPSAAKTYADQVKKLDAKLALAQRNAPLERQAQIIAANAVRAKRAAHPEMDKDNVKKLQYKELERARLKVGAKKKESRIELTQDEWDAIQAGAISNSKLEAILANTDIDKVRDFATPKVKRLMTSSRVAQAKALFAQGYTRAEVASRLGVSLTTLDESVKQGGR